jgi:hypothetical protein
VFVGRTGSLSRRTLSEDKKQWQGPKERENKEEELENVCRWKHIPVLLSLFSFREEVQHASLLNSGRDDQTEPGADSGT